MTAAIEFPLTVAQRGVLDAEAGRLGRSSYNNPLALRITGPLDLEALDRAFAAAVARHPLLRGAVVEGAEPALRVPGDRPAPALERDAGHPAGPPEPAALDAELARYAALPFDLVEGPLVRARVYPLDRDDHVLHLVAHHLVADGTSIDLLAADVSRAYRAELGGGPGEAGAPPAPYADHARWEHRWLAEGGHRDELRSWEEYLEGVPDGVRLAVPGRAADGGGSGAPLTRRFPVDDVAALRRGAARNRGTLFVAALTALQWTLHRHSGRRRFTVRVPFSGRVEPELAGTVGYFVNVLPLRAVIEPGSTPAELFAANSAELPDLLDRQLVPAPLFAAARPADGAAAVLLNLRPPREPLFAEHGSPARVVLAEPVVGYQLSLVAQEEGDRLVFDAQADPAVLTEADLVAITDGFSTLLSELAAPGADGRAAP
ncbi:condensation domain-containing protein [Kitasatospora sp. NPDC004272]